MGKPVSNLRLFVAIYPPVDLATSWRDLLGDLDLPAHRLVPVEQIHLTVQFIGDTPAKALDDVIESVERAASGLPRFNLAIERMMALPQRGPQRLIAVESNTPATLLELKTRLATRLAKRARDKPSHGFKPHFTLCRFRSPTRLPDGWCSIAMPPACTVSFPAARVALMRSTLKPSGAEHVEVAGFELLRP